MDIKFFCEVNVSTQEGVHALGSVMTTNRRFIKVY